MDKLDQAQKQLLRQLLHNALIEDYIYKEFENRKESAFRSILSANTTEDLFKYQGKLMVWEEVLKLLKHYRGEYG